MKGQASHFLAVWLFQFAFAELPAQTITSGRDDWPYRFVATCFTVWASPDLFIQSLVTGVGPEGWLH